MGTAFSSANINNNIDQAEVPSTPTAGDTNFWYYSSDFCEAVESDQPLTFSTNLFVTRRPLGQRLPSFQSISSVRLAPSLDYTHISCAPVVPVLFSEQQSRNDVDSTWPLCYPSPQPYTIAQAAKNADIAQSMLQRIESRTRQSSPVDVLCGPSPSSCGSPASDHLLSNKASSEMRHSSSWHLRSPALSVLAAEHRQHQLTSHLIAEQAS